jgi:hypothetical protein
MMIAFAWDYSLNCVFYKSRLGSLCPIFPIRYQDDIDVT